MATAEEILAGARSASQRASALLASAKPTISAGEIKDTTAVDVGMFPMADTTAITDAKLSATGILESLVAQQEVSLKREEEARKAQTALGPKPTADVAGTQVAAEEQYGVSALKEKQTEQSLKVASIKSELDKIELLQQQEIDRTRAQMANVPTYVVDRQVNQINRDFASQKAYVAVELSAQAAILSIYQGDLAGAQAQVQNAVQNYIYDLTQKREDFDQLFNYYGDWIKELDKEQQNILTEARGEAGRQEDNARKDAEFKYKQMIDKAELELAWYKATDSGLGVTGITSFDDILQQAINNGATPEGAAREAALASENIGIQVTQKQIQAWTETARGLSVQITPVGQPTISPTPAQYGEALKEAPGKVVSEVGKWWMGQEKEFSEFTGGFFSGLFAD